jgi:hypothetical protein
MGVNRISKAGSDEIQRSERKQVMSYNVTRQSGFSPSDPGKQTTVDGIPTVLDALRVALDIMTRDAGEFTDVGSD